MNLHLRIQQTFQFFLQKRPFLSLLFPLQVLQSSTPLSPIKLHFYNFSTTVSLSQAVNFHSHLQEPEKWNLAIRHASATDPSGALSLFQEMNPFYDDPFIYASLVKACGKAGAFLEGKSIHCRVIRLGLDCNVNVMNSLVSFYCVSVNLMSYAAVLFDAVSEKSVVSVNCIMSGHVKRGNLDMGLSMFVKMLRGSFGLNVKPNYVSFVILVSGCIQYGEFGTGKAVHCCCCKMGLDGEIELSNALIDLYAKFGCMFDAVSVFRGMARKDFISWNTVILGYVNNKNYRKAFSFFTKMRIEDTGVDKVSFSCLVSACADSKNLSLGRTIHALVKVVGLESDVSVGTALIHMYAKCRKLESARKLFDELPKHNIEFCNSMIHAYVENGLAPDALGLFDEIKIRRLEPDEVTILGLIMASRDTGELGHTISVQSILDNNDKLKGNIVLANALIDMYAKCGSMALARDVFDRMQRKDVVSWTSIIMGYAINGQGDKSLAAFEQMCSEKIVPNSVTFIGVLAACDHAGLVDDGRKLYKIMRDVYHIKPWIKHCGCMVDMLARAGKMEEAQKFIREMPIEPNALIWRMLIHACRVHGHVDLGLNLVTGITELENAFESADSVISSNIFAEAGRWSDVMSYRRSMAVHGVPKVVGKSSISYLTE